jgi:hypothetical protein
MAQIFFHTHNLRIKIPVQKHDDIYISDSESEDISNSPLPHISSSKESAPPEGDEPLCEETLYKEVKGGVFSRIYYYCFACCFE